MATAPPAKSNRILVVDDEPRMLEVCADVLRKIPRTEVVVEEQSRRAAERLEGGTFDVLVSDVRMPGLDGVELLRLAHDKHPDLIVVMLTAFPSVEVAVECMKLGAADFVTKPNLPDDLLATVQRLLEARRLENENRLLGRQLERSYAFDEIVGDSAAIRSVFETIERVAKTGVDVLITGETGVGKELVARSIHKRSKVAGRFVPVDCAAIPEDLLESELFGHERGAFTGADRASLGLVELAQSGTLFLDEIAELSPRLQAKLLRVLQERTIRRVGGKELIDVEVRLLAATNRDLEVEVRDGGFRSDLYYRVNVVRIAIPPLRERPEDIPLLVEHFAHRFSREMGREGLDVHREVPELLASHPWPGNVRELQNVLKRAIAMARHETLRGDDLPPEILARTARPLDSEGSCFFDLRARHVNAFEAAYLRDLLIRHGGNVSQAAADAQVPRGTLYRLLDKHGLRPKDHRE